MAELGQRRAGAASGALLDVERMNEEIKGGALSQLASFAGGFPQSTGFGGGFSQLFGAGLQGLLSDSYGSNYDFLSKLGMENRRFPVTGRDVISNYSYRQDLGQFRR